MQIDLVAWHRLWMVSIWCTDLDSSRIKGERNSLIGVHRRARMVIQYSCIWHFLSPWSAPGLPRDISRAADLGQDFSSLWSVMTGPGEATRAPGTRHQGIRASGHQGTGLQLSVIIPGPHLIIMGRVWARRAWADLRTSEEKLSGSLLAQGALTLTGVTQHRRMRAKCNPLQ